MNCARCGKAEARNKIAHPNLGDKWLCANCYSEWHTFTNRYQLSKKFSIEYWCELWEKFTMDFRERVMFI